jgi:hypothetical protein
LKFNLINNIWERLSWIFIPRSLRCKLNLKILSSRCILWNLENKFGCTPHTHQSFFILLSLIFPRNQTYILRAISNYLIMKSIASCWVFTSTNHNLLALFNILRIRRSILIKSELAWFDWWISLAFLFILVIRFFVIQFIHDSYRLYFYLIFKLFNYEFGFNFSVGLLRSYLIFFKYWNFFWLV